MSIYHFVSCVSFHSLVLVSKIPDLLLVSHLTFIHVMGI